MTTYAAAVAKGEADPPFVWYDVAVARRAIAVSTLLAAPASHRPRSIEELNVLQEFFVEHIRHLYSLENLATHSNHGIAHLLALMNACKNLPATPLCAGADRWGSAQLGRVLRQHYSDEGMHLEHSPFYHVAVTQLLAIADTERVFSANKLVGKAQSLLPLLCMPNPQSRTTLCR